MKKSFFNNKNIHLFVGIITLLLLSGCSQKNDIGLDLINDIQRNKIHTKPYQLKITPIIGTRQDDAKVVMDMGKIIKVWVAPYKNGKTLVSSHDNYVVAQAPDFIIGESIPNKNWRGLVTPDKKIPFLFRNSDLDNAQKLEEEEIVKYNNVVYQQQNDEELSKNRLKESNVFDEEIKKFLNQ